MSYEKAAKSVYRALNDPSTYPIRSLNRFKTDPRVKVGPCCGVGDDWAVFDFAAELQRSRGRWLLFRARSRFYAVDAKNARDARRIIEQYRPIRVVAAVTPDRASDSPTGTSPPRVPSPTPHSLEGIIPLRLARVRFLGLLAARRTGLERQPSEKGSRERAVRYR